MKKIKTRPKIINIKNANTITIKLIFFNNHTKEDTIKNRIMNRILRNCNNKYKTAQELGKKIEELLIINLTISTKSYIEKEITTVTITVPKEGILPNFNIEECIKLLYETIYNPYIENDEFNKNCFNWERDFILNIEKRYPNNIYEYVEEEKIKIINKVDDVYITHEEYMNFIEKQTPRTIYEQYIKKIKNNNFITYIYGNIENKERILKIFNKYFKQEKQEITIDTNYTKYLKLTKYQEYQQKKKFNQSVLLLIYQIDKLKKDEKILLDTLYYFLNSTENDLIFQNLRVKNNLIYDARVLENTLCGYIEIMTFLDEKEVEKAQRVITETFKDIKDEANFKIYKERLLKALRYDILTEEDNNYNIVKDIIQKNLKDEYSIKGKYEIIKNITSKEMNNFINRLKLTRKLTIIGDVNEET